MILQLAAWAVVIWAAFHVLVWATAAVTMIFEKGRKP